MITENLRRQQAIANIVQTIRSMTAARMVTTSMGGDRHCPYRNEISVAVAAKLLQVSPRSVSYARKILRSGHADIISMVDSGELNIARAMKLIESRQAKAAIATANASESA